MSEDQGTILIIEDDPRMQKVLHRIFHDEGYQVEVASDGRAGVDSFISLQPSAVVLDLILPPAESGGPGSDSTGRPAERSFVVIEVRPSTPTLSKS